MDGEARSVVNLESPLPAPLPAGSRTALYVSGTASAGNAPVADLELVIGGDAVRLDAIRMPRFDMPLRRSGFWGVVPFTAPSHPRPVELRARARSADGAAGDLTLGELTVAEAPPPATAKTGLIAVCMATFEPQLELLRRQLESLRAQTDTGWTCVISDDHSRPEYFAALQRLVGDDERFVLSRSEERIGFYRNFERALRMAPPEAELFALCDQDDVWRPDKLAVLRASLGDATLVYSDQRLVDAHGSVLRETLWRGRANNSTNIASMLIANTVTGAAALFRREVAERALPFPDSPGIEFHDHWIALVALASGELRYLDRPLYDYVQHDAAILGKVVGRPPRARRVALPRMREWRAAYFLGYIPGRVRAATLLMRCHDELTPGKRRALERYLSADSSPVAFARFVLRPLRALAGRTETLGGEWELAPGIVWFQIAKILAAQSWLPDRFTLDTRFPDPPHFEHRRLQRWRARI